jgi:hypothetical protein
MSDSTGARSRKPQNPDARAHSHPPPSPTAGKRPIWRRILAPLVLFGLGVVLFLLAVWEYPSTPPRLSTPPFTRVFIDAPPISDLGYAVAQAGPTITTMAVTFSLSGKHPPAHAAAGLDVILPSGAIFLQCPTPPAGVRYPPCRGSSWLAAVPFDSKGKVELYFAVKARSFNLAVNGVNASVAIPEIKYIGHGPAKLRAIYKFPSPSSYDWSFSPPFMILKNAIEWDQVITSGDNMGRVAVGTNYARQASDDNKTFIAGALLGLAGGAILSAVQELLHAND